MSHSERGLAGAGRAPWRCGTGNALVKMPRSRVDGPRRIERRPASERRSGRPWTFRFARTSRFAEALAIALLFLAGLVGCAHERGLEAEPPPPEEAAPSAENVCYDCFWEYQPAELREKLMAYYEGYKPADPLIDADRKYLLARMSGDAEDLCAARSAFDAARETVVGPERRLLVEETLAFTAEICGADPSIAFARAAGAAESAEEKWKAGVYHKIATGDFHPEFGELEIRRRLEVPAGARGYILGESAIRVKPGARVGVQVERTLRDWLSNQLAWDFSATSPPREAILDWHEGARLRDILATARAEVVPLTGTLVAHRDDAWYAPDENGVFRFEVLPDKVEYPTTRAWGDLALLVDTHGISALVEPAVRAGAQLVIGCGDYTDKMKAAFDLAARGVDVYFPCDRFVGDLIGYDGRGTLIGSAPVRAESGAAVIGDRPVRFAIDEPIVAEDSEARGAGQYYDAPARFFRRLAESVPLKLDIVTVAGPGGSATLVARAKEIGASAIAVRVQTAEDAAPVRAWLAASPTHRAVLFHTAPYPAGYALFAEFPRQTTFGDPRPRFVTG